MNAVRARDPHASGVIPFRVRIGVTGHRHIPAASELEDQVRRVVGRIADLAPGQTPTRLAVVSPLAEGADQLVARVVLEEDPEATLEALLPLSQAEYLRRFETEESRPGFHELAARASSVIAVGREPGAPEQAYEEVGRYVVDSSDVVIALWDGQPARGPGGTASVVAYTRGEPAPREQRARGFGRGAGRVGALQRLFPRQRAERRVPLVWIDTCPPFAVREEAVESIFGESFRELDRYNAAKVRASAFRRETTARKAGLLDAAEGVGLDGGHVEPYCDWILPYYARADVLADRWQTRYRRFSNTLFFAAAGAVMAVAAQVLFAPEQPRLVAAEVGLLALVLAALFAGRRLRVHERWISYRVLAERFRSALFLALVGAEPKLESASEQGRLGPTGQWPRRAFDEVWRARPQASPAGALTDALKRFVMLELIDDQLRYHRKATERYRRRQRLLARATYVLFGTTLVAAVLHTLEVGGHGAGGGLTFGNVLIFLAVGLPAAGSALAGIEAQRQYERNLERSKGMTYRLESARQRMQEASSLDGVRAVAQETESILLDESNDWLVTVRFQGIKLAV